MEVQSLRLIPAPDSFGNLGEEGAIEFTALSMKEVKVPVSNAAKGGTYALSGILILGSICHILCVRKSKNTNDHGATQAIFGLCTWTNTILFCAYVLMSCSHLFFQSNAGIKDSSALLVVAMICFIKFAISIGLFVCKNPPAAQSAEKEQVLFGQWVFLTFIPGALFASYDVMSFWSLANVSPLTYQICIHGRIALVAIFYQFAFARMLSASQWFAILLFIWAGLIQVVEHMGGQAVNESLLGLLLIMGQLCISAIANVMSEKILKMRSITAPTELVIASQNLWSMILLLLAVFCTDRDLLGVNVWLIIQDKWTVCSMLNLAVFGVVTCYFLRNLSNILRELSASIVVIMTFAVQLVVGFEFSGFGLVSSLVSIAALSVYNVDPL